MTQLISLLLSAAAPAAAEPACRALTSPQSVLECALGAHPAAEESAALLSQAEALGGAAGQRPNPEAESAGVFGASQDQIEVSILHTFEIGGKRRRRLDRARAEALALGAEALSVREEIAVDVVSGLYRLRHIREEMKLLREAQETFSRIARALRGRPRRSPEQEVSLSVFQLAERDYAVKASALEGESLALRRTLELGLRAPLPDSDAVLPARPVRWPDPDAAAAAFRGSAALVLVLMMIYAAFKNVYETLLIFSCVPLALVGGVLGLMLNGLPFSISAGVGFIALTGIAVLNGVVLVHYFNDLRAAEGLSGWALVEKGTLIRLRPVLMTALVEIFGFLPMMLATGLGAEVQRPLASVVIGGVISSTALTLLVLPALYLMLERRMTAYEMGFVQSGS